MKDEADTTTEWDRQAILRHIPRSDALTDLQQTALVKAVRNPDASIARVNRECGTESNALGNVLWRLEQGGFDANADYDPVLDKGSRKFRERSLKQRAAIHFHARHPDVFDSVTYEQAAERCTDETGVSMHWSTLHLYLKDHGDLIERRRLGPHVDSVEPLDPDAEPDRRYTDGDGVTLRSKLESAGITRLPDENLDDLPTPDEAVEQGRQLGGQRAKATHASNGAASNGSTETTTEDEDTGEDDAEDDADDSERVNMKRGNRSYSGPSSGLDLTGGARAPSLLADRGTGKSAVDEAFAKAREENGEFGENAYKRSVDINDRESLETEIRRLRMIVASQGAMLKSLKNALDHLTVDVSVGYTDPEATPPATDPGEDE